MKKSKTHPRIAAPSPAKDFTVSRIGLILKSSYANETVIRYSLFTRRRTYKQREGPEGVSFAEYAARSPAYVTSRAPSLQLSMLLISSLLSPLTLNRRTTVTRLDMTCKLSLSQKRSKYKPACILLLVIFRSKPSSIKFIKVPRNQHQSENRPALSPVFLPINPSLHKFYVRA